MSSRTPTPIGRLAGYSHKRAKNESSMGLDQALKLVAVAGAFIFVGLFTSYDQFYASLGVSPEDVGVTYSYLLARALGIGLIAGPGVGLLLLLLLVIMRPELLKRMNWLLKRMDWALKRPAILTIVILFVIAIMYLAAFLIPSRVQEVAQPRGYLLGSAVFLTLSVIAFAASRIYREAPNRPLHPPLVAMALFAVTAASVSGFVGLAYTAGLLADNALDGEPVHEIRVAGLSVLNVRSESTVVTWVAPPAQRPTVFGSDSRACMMYIGQNATDMFFLVPIHGRGDIKPTVRLPRITVATEGVSAEECRRVDSLGK